MRAKFFFSATIVAIFMMGAAGTANAYGGAYPGHYDNYDDCVGDDEGTFDYSDWWQFECREFGDEWDWYYLG